MRLYSLSEGVESLIFEIELNCFWWKKCSCFNLPILVWTSCVLSQNCSSVRGGVNEKRRRNLTNLFPWRYINFNAYIQTCIWGTSFCVSAFNAFWLIFRNLARISAVTGVTFFISIIGQIFVIMASSFRWSRTRLIMCRRLRRVRGVGNQGQRKYHF